MKSHRVLALLALALTTVLLAACGDDGSTSTAAGPARGGAVSIVDDTGRRIELDAPAERIVTGEWDHTENALALGVTPVGAGDTDAYRDWVGAGKPIPQETESIGKRHEPSLEKIATLDPDVILMGADTALKNRAQLERIAPVVVFDGFVEPSRSGEGAEWDRMVSQFERTATLLGREREAELVLARVDRDVASARAQIADAGHAGDTMALAQGYTSGKPVARLFDDGAWLVQVADRVGLRNAFDGKPESWGITQVGLEGMRQVGDADWLFTMALPEDDPFRGPWARNPAFQRLPVVERRHVRDVGSDTWTWGGPLTAALAAERFADAVTASQG